MEEWSGRTKERRQKSQCAYFSTKQALALGRQATAALRRRAINARLRASPNRFCPQILIKGFAANPEVFGKMQALFAGRGAAAQLFDTLRRQGFFAAAVRA